mmetsp:Transcript_22920/g.54211  ORF Transcript_22920/g.54211 Transcript_22920/m.54211 type:complete len:1085 (+) Transcript_22920:123-3377(+)
MKRGRGNKAKAKNVSAKNVKDSAKVATPPPAPSSSRSEFRQSQQPIVIVTAVSSDNDNSITMTNDPSRFCSQQAEPPQWTVLIHQIIRSSNNNNNNINNNTTSSTTTWWERHKKSSRLLNGATAPIRVLQKQRGCHVIVILHQHQHQHQQQQQQQQLNLLAYQALKRLGEDVSITSVALLQPPNVDIGAAPGDHPIRQELEPLTAVQIWKGDETTELFQNYVALRRLWTFQDNAEQQQQQQHNLKLSFDQVPLICRDWSPLHWRWNCQALQELNRQLHTTFYLFYQGEQQADDNETTLPTLASWGRQLELKAAQLLQNDDTQRVASLILSAGVVHLQHQNSNHNHHQNTSVSGEAAFGRLYSWAVHQQAVQKQTRGMLPRNIQVTASTKNEILNAYQYATVQDCTPTLEQLTVATEETTSLDTFHRTKDQQTLPQTFSIPMLWGNAMTTMRLIPSLFPTHATPQHDSADFDTVLGSRRLWTDALALRASIVFLFQSPGGGGNEASLWNVAFSVIQHALPRTWQQVLTHAVHFPQETFLRALLHPQVMESGRLVRWSQTNGHDNDADSSLRVLPPTLDTLSRIYALGRFVKTTLDTNKMSTMWNDASVCKAVASTMQLEIQQVRAVVQSHRFDAVPLTAEKCLEILDLVDLQDDNLTKDVDESSQMRDALGMLAVFLNYDRKSVRDSNRMDTFDMDNEPYQTSKALADCAMYCGAIKWLQPDDDDEEGIWTCLPCLRRWQKRGNPREAFQTRKLMHPMKLTPFTRDEYYNKAEWDEIQRATLGDISRLGVDDYWGTCSGGCQRICRAVPRAGACDETDGVPLYDFPETVVIRNNDVNNTDNDGQTAIPLRHSLESSGTLIPANGGTVPASSLEQFFDSEEKLLYLSAELRRRVRNCIDKSTFVLPHGVLCDICGAMPDTDTDDHCPYCGLMFEPVFACVHYHCPRCSKHFCKACLGIDGMHYDGVYNARNHVCWRVLGNRYAYHNKGVCQVCNKERPWPSTHKLKSAGPEICRQALALGKELPLETAVAMQAQNLEEFTRRYKEGVKIFLEGTHTRNLGREYCKCDFGKTVQPNDGDFHIHNDYE